MADLTTNAIPKATGATQVDDSNYADNGDGDVTVDISTAGEVMFGAPGPIVSGANGYFGLSIVPADGEEGIPNLVLVGYGSGNVPTSGWAFANGVAGTPTAVLNGNKIVSHTILGYGTDEFKNIAEVRVTAQEDFTNSAHGVSYAIRTSAIGQNLVDRIVIDSAGNTDIKNGVLTIESHAPAAPDSTGVAGAVTWDSGFVYVCVATDTWVRAALTTWV